MIHPAPAQPVYRSLIYLLTAFICAAVAFDVPAAHSANYYLDASYGNDSNDGSEASPWKSLSKAWASAPAGSTVLVAAGSYGTFSVDAPRPGISRYITFRALEGDKPRLEGISMLFPDLADAYVRFQGFVVHRFGVGNVVFLRNVRHVQVTDSEIRAAKWAEAGVGAVGVYVSGAEDIQIADNYLHEIHRGISVRRTRDISITGNLIRPKGGTGIQYAGGNTAGLIEANHIKGASYTAYPEDPDAVPSPHASIISVRSSNLAIMGNLLHDMGSSSGVMFYEPDAAGGEKAYSNIQMQNNAILNTSNNYAVRIYNLGDNFILSNNLIFSRAREGECNGLTKDARYRYNTALIVHGEGEGHDGSGLELYNNIFVGILSVGENVRESNNVIWSWKVSSDWLVNTPGSNSKIVTSAYGGCEGHATLFEDGSFFKSPLDFSHLKGDESSKFLLVANSPGANFADPTRVGPGSLGSVGADGFLRDNGEVRSDAATNVGPYVRFQDVMRSPPGAPDLLVE